MLTNHPNESRHGLATLAPPPGALPAFPPGGMLPPPSSQIDLVKLAWRYRLLLLLGLAVGLGGGYYHYIQSPELYLSSARLQIVDPISNNLPVQSLEASASSRSLGDEALVMRSEGILRRAAELGALNQAPGFRGRSADQIAGQLTRSLALKVGQANQNAKTSVFEISYQTGDPLTAQRVVQAIADAYAEHLQSQYQNVGLETLELIRSARDDVLKRLESIEDEFDAFKQSSPLVMREGRATSVHRDNADKFLAQRQSLIVRRAQLNSSLRAAEAAIEAGEPMESVLLALSGGNAATATTELGAGLEQATASQLKQLEEETRLPASEQMRQTRLLPLELRANELKQQLGDGHPAVKTLQAEVELVISAVERLAQSEAEFAEKSRQLREASQQGRDRALTPEEVVRRNLDFRLLALRQQLVSVEQELDVISEAYEFETEAAKNEHAAEMQVARYGREIERQRSLYERIVARLDEIDIMADAGSLRVFPLETAKPGHQIAPKVAKSLLLGGLLGFLCAGGLAYIRELSDKSYRSAEQIAEHLRIPVIGHIPSMKGDKKLAKQLDSSIDPFLVSFFRPKSATAEAFKAIRTALYFSNRGGDSKVIQLTSPTPGDGKSTIAANLAITMAQSGKRVLLLDTDLRRPRVQRLFGIDTDRGLAWLLEQLPDSPGMAELQVLANDTIVPTEIPNLSVLGAGDRPENPSELLSSPRLDALLRGLRAVYDVIIVDSPPMLAVTDPSTIASRVDAVLMVVRVRKNIKPLAARTARMLETLDANVLGVIVNGVGSRDAKGYGKEADSEGYYNRGQSYQYGYGYTYGSNGDGRYNEYYSDDSERARRKVSKPVARPPVASPPAANPPEARPPAASEPAARQVLDVAVQPKSAAGPRRGAVVRSS